MAFHEIRLPTYYDYKSSGGPGVETLIHEMPNKASSRVGIVEAPRRKFILKSSNLTFTKLYELLSFFLARGGATYGFRLKDWGDYSTASDGISTPGYEDVTITLSAPSGQRVFQMIKKYTSGGVTHTRTIKKPVQGTVKVSLSGGQLTEGSAYTVNYETGNIIFQTNPFNSAVRFGCEFDVPVRFTGMADKDFPFFLDNPMHGSAHGLEMIEITHDLSRPGGLNNGGGTDQGLQTAWLDLLFSNGRVQVFEYDTASKGLDLPSFYDSDISQYIYGGPHLFIHNASGSANSIEIRSNDHISIMSALAAGDAVMVVLHKDGAGDREALYGEQI